MTPDLTLLVWATALTLVRRVIAVLEAQTLVGLRALAGNRENLPPVAGQAGRAATCWKALRYPRH
jgi:hypothetical protein